MATLKGIFSLSAQRTLSSMFFCLLVVIVATPSISSSSSIVDTGPGGTTGSMWSLFGAGAVSDPFGQSLAAEFTMVSADTISSVEGWMNFTAADTDGTIAIYSDGGDIPGTELFSATFFGTGVSQPSWVGASGLSWSLAAGTYWVAFEVRAGQTLDTSMPSPSSSPLLNEAFTSSTTDTWFGSDNEDIGVRINASVVPEPAALSLVGISLVGLFGYRRGAQRA